MTLKNSDTDPTDDNSFTKDFRSMGPTSRQNKKRFEILVLVITLASVGTALILYFTDLELKGIQLTALNVFDFIVTSVLAIDFYCRMKKSRDSHAKFILKNMYELPAMLPLILFTAIEDQLVIGAAMRSFRLLRLFRLVRLLRLANMFRATKYIDKTGFVYFLAIAGSAMIFGSVGIYAVEGGVEKSPIKTYEDAFWFSLTSMTISGYGDVYPVTSGGRIIGAILIVIGLALILGFFASLWSGLIVSRTKQKTKFTDEDRQQIKEKIDHLEKLDVKDVEALNKRIKNLHETLTDKKRGS